MALMVSHAEARLIWCYLPSCLFHPTTIPLTCLSVSTPTYMHDFILPATQGTKIIRFWPNMCWLYQWRFPSGGSSSRELSIWMDCIGKSHKDHKRSLYDPAIEEFISMYVSVPIVCDQYLIQWMDGVCSWFTKIEIYVITIVDVHP